MNKKARECSLAFFLLIFDHLRSYRGKQSPPVGENKKMKVIYDPETDTLDMILRDSKVVESDEDKPGIILDYDAEGKIVSIEILEASKMTSLPIGISFELAPSSPVH